MPARSLEADKKAPRAQALALRCPILPFDDLLRWAAPGWQIAADDPRFEAAFEESRSVLRRRLREALWRPEVREGLFLVSSDFFQAVEGWTPDREQAQPRSVEGALAEQLVRLATVVDFVNLELAPSLGEIGGRARLRLGALSGRHSRIDIRYLRAAAQAAAALPSVERELRFFANSSLYRVGAKVRYVASESEAGEYRLASAELTPRLDAILRRAEPGATSEELISAAMSADAELSREDAESYVEELIGRQLLEADFGPSLTGGDAHGELAERLAGIPEAEGIRRSLDRAREAIGRIDWEPFSGDASRYPEISKLLSTSGASSPLLRVRIFRSATDACLPEAIAREVLRGAEVLASIEGRDDPIRQFTDSFLGRYGDAVVPLVEALDDEHGIGFPASLEGRRESASVPPPSGAGASLGAKEQRLLGKIEESWRSGSQVISLSWQEIASIRASNALPLADSFCVRGALCARSEAALAAGDYSFRIDGVSGSPAWAVLGPMASSDPQLEERVARYLREEESLQPDAIFAEIVHFPRVGDPNLLVRPKLRAKEIFYFARSGANKADRIDVGDLRLSVAGGRLQLTSERLGCEVIPRLTAPHDFTHPANPTLYRFLCALQNQGRAAQLQWSWGTLAVAASLPRVVCGKLILCPARWVLDAQMLAQNANSTAAGRFRALCRIRERLQLPRFVQTGGGPRASAFDLENVLSAESLIQKIHTDRRAAIYEMFPAGDTLCTFGPQGRYVHELTIAFLRR